MARLLSPTTEEDSLIKYKIVLVGDATVGKTSLINAFIHRDVAEKSTLAATCTAVEYEIDGLPLHLSIWDTAGQETFRNLVPVYARGAHAAILVFDHTNPTSFKNLAEWYSFVLDRVGHIPCVVACNKSDLPATVDVALVDSWIKEQGIQMICTSAAAKVNVDALFQALLTALVRQTHGVSTPVKAPVELEKDEEENECC
jgi:small GTP-binding protein